MTTPSSASRLAQVNGIELGYEVTGEGRPLSEGYQKVAPRVEDWPVLVRQVAEGIKVDYDWSAEIPSLSCRPCW